MMIGIVTARKTSHNGVLACLTTCGRAHTLTVD